MSSERPRVVIGMPVFNGEAFLGEAIASILAQTYTDFRLLIADNASTDGTGDICNVYARQDSRIVYHRHDENLGASRNYNFVFQPRGAPYFKWAAHDDVLEPDFLSSCVQLLDADPALAIAHCPTIRIDERGMRTGDYDYEMRLSGPRPQDRFWRLLWVVHFTEVFGVMRSDLIARTALHGSFVGSDRNFMAEMLLQGDVGYCEKYLFRRRHHANSFCNALKDDAARLKWFDPKATTPKRLAAAVKFREYTRSIFRFDLPLQERIACLRMLGAWVTRRTLEVVTNRHDAYRNHLITKRAA